MVKKKNKNIILIVTLIIVGLFILNYFQVFENLRFKTFSTIVLQNGTSASPYVCPPNVFGCNIRGGITCNTALNPPRVVFRATERTQFPTQIAVDIDGDGDLEALTKTTSSTTQNICGSIGTTKIRDGFGSTLYERTGGEIILCSNTENKVYSKVGNIPLDRYPVAGYYQTYNCINACPSGILSNPLTGEKININGANTKEIYDLSISVFSCDGKVKVEKSLTDTSQIKSEDLVYRSETSGGVTKTDTFQIEPNNVIRVTGGQSQFVEYEVLEMETTPEKECTIDICNSDNTGIIKCNNNEYSDDILPCQDDLGERCLNSQQGAFCKQKFTLSDFKFRDFLNTKDVLSYTPSEVVGIKFKFTSSVTGSINSKIFIYKDEEEIYSKNYNILLNQFNFLTLTNLQNPGTYKLVIEILDGNKVIPFGRGGDLTFGVTATALDSNFKFSTKLIDEQTGAEFTSTKLYTNNPIEIIYRTFEAGDTDHLISPDSYNIVAKIGGQQITLPKPDESIGLVTYTININQPGLLRFEGTSTRAGRTSNLASLESQVSVPEVRVKYLNAENLVSLKPGTTKNIEFETRSAIGHLVSSTNVVRVIVTGGTEQSITTIQGSNGIYNFDYTFGKQGDNPSAYQFFITSSAINHQTSSRTQSPLINVAEQNDEVIKECTSDSQCQTGYQCNSANKCELIGGGINIILYLVIGIAVLLVVILIVFLLGRRKKQTTFNL